MIKIDKITLECGSCGAKKTRTDVAESNTFKELIENIRDTFDRDSYELRYLIDSDVVNPWPDAAENPADMDILCSSCADRFIGRGEW